MKILLKETISFFNFINMKIFDDEIKIIQQNGEYYLLISYKIKTNGKVYIIDQRKIKLQKDFFEMKRLERILKIIEILLSINGYSKEYILTIKYIYLRIYNKYDDYKILKILNCELSDLKKLKRNTINYIKNLYR